MVPFKSRKKSYSYYDFQLWPVFFGIGVGQIIDDKGNKCSRLKAGAGLWGYLTFDYLSFENLKYNFGAIRSITYTCWRATTALKSSFKHTFLGFFCLWVLKISKIVFVR